MEDIKHFLESCSGFLTTAKATFCGMGFSLFTWLSQENVVWVLTVLVLVCQLASWGYKFRNWWKGRK